MKKTFIASTALAVTAAAGATVLVATPASADVERRGTCAGATYELNVDRERGGFEVDADVDGARPGSESSLLGLWPSAERERYVAANWSRGQCVGGPI